MQQEHEHTTSPNYKSTTSLQSFTWHTVAAMHWQYELTRWKLTKDKDCSRGYFNKSVPLNSYYPVITMLSLKVLLPYWLPIGNSRLIYTHLKILVNIPPPAPWNQSLRTTCLSLAIISSIGCSHVVSIGLAKILVEILVSQQQQVCPSIIYLEFWKLHKHV